MTDRKARAAELHRDRTDDDEYAAMLAAAAEATSPRNVPFGGQ